MKMAASYWNDQTKTIGAFMQALHQSNKPNYLLVVKVVGEPDNKRGTVIREELYKAIRGDNELPDLHWQTANSATSQF